MHGRAKRRRGDSAPPPLRGRADRPTPSRTREAARDRQPTAPQPDEAWRERAACRDVDDPELFFPAAESGPARDAQVAAAKAVCARCPVRAECLTEALARIPYGIAGGLTEHERRRLRTRPRRPGSRRG